MTRKTMPYNERKLTKAQKEILQTLKDNPMAYISEGYRHSYTLWYWSKGQSLSRPIQFDTMMFLRYYWLKERPRLRGESVTYTIKPGAEISDKWRDEEQKRMTAEYARRQTEKEAKEQAEREQARQKYEEVWQAIQACDLEVAIEWGGIQFTVNGVRYVIREDEYQ